MGQAHDSQADVLENPGYEVFILALSVVSLVNLVLVLPFSPLDDVQRVVLFTIDSLLSIVFLGDFARRLLRAESKRAYLWRGGGWLDLLGSLPALRVARIFRVVRVTRLLRSLGVRPLGVWLVHERAQSALYVVTFAVVVVLETAAVSILAFEAGSPDANITTGGDALWWGLVTITTVGYGDLFPVTTDGRIVGAFLLVAGVGLFATFTGFLANAFLAPRKARPPRPTDDAGPRLVDEIRSELVQLERRSAELRGRLDDLERLL